MNLERVRSQLEGAVVVGLSHALYGEITMKDGASGGDLHLSLQADCNLVIYDGAWNARWQSGTAGCVNRLFVP